MDVPERGQEEANWFAEHGFRELFVEEFVHLKGVLPLCAWHSVRCLRTFGAHAR